MSDASWTLEPGDKIERKDLHARYGGRTQGGIGPSKQSPNVFIFSDPVSGEQHGYFDGWQADGCFHYTGEGQRGDQRMVSGNRSINDHKSEGRSLRVFDGARGEVTYLGEFALDAELPWYETDAPETGGGPVRQVIVFRLRPIGLVPGAPSAALAPLSPNAEVTDVAVEEQWTERTVVEPSREPYEAERREATLVKRLQDDLRRRGHTVHRKKITPPGERKPLFTDLFDETAQVLVEAKGTGSREAVRMALGQLLDYARFLDQPILAILTPARLRADLEALAVSAGVALVWPDGESFASSPADLFG